MVTLNHGQKILKIDATRQNNSTIFGADNCPQSRMSTLPEISILFVSYKVQ